jgi:hypothetical protein
MLEAATEPDVAGELAGLGAAPPEPPVEDVGPAAEPARLDEELAERFFAEGTFVDSRFLGRKGPGAGEAPG